MPSLLMLLPLPAEEGAGMHAVLVGVGSLVLLLVLLVALLAFGKGREHS